MRLNQISITPLPLQNMRVRGWTGIIKCGKKRPN